MTGAPALWTKHRPLARKLAADYYLPGADRQDIEQEAMIALWTAARGWRPDRGSSFPTFARLVIKRRLDDLVRSAFALRQRPLNGSVRVVHDDEGMVSISDQLPGGTDPATVVADRETFRRLLDAIDRLTPLEHQAIIAVLNGTPQDEQTDNAAWRARRKLRAAMAEQLTLR